MNRQVILHDCLIIVDVFLLCPRHGLAFKLYLELTLCAGIKSRFHMDSTVGNHFSYSLEILPTFDPVQINRLRVA